MNAMCRYCDATADRFTAGVPTCPACVNRALATFELDERGQ